MKQISFAIVAIILGLGVLEGVTRLINITQEGPLEKPGAKNLAFRVKDLYPYVFFRKLPSLELRPRKDFFHNFNGKSVKSKKEPGEFRVFLLGGSVARGFGASTPNKSFHHILERILNEHSDKPPRLYYNVISAGRLGYVSAQELIFLQMGILEFKPDFVVHLNGANDILTVTQYKEPPGYPFYHQSLKRAFEAVEIEKTIDKSLGKSAFLTELDMMFKKYKKSAPEVTSQNINRHYRRNMTHSAQLLKANNISGLITLQPLLLEKKQLAGQEISANKRIKPHDRQIWLTTYNKLYTSLEAVSAETGIIWKSFQHAFDEEKEEVFHDTVHLNDHGQQLLAEELLNAIMGVINASLTKEE